MKRQIPVYTFEGRTTNKLAWSVAIHGLGRSPNCFGNCGAGTGHCLASTRLLPLLGLDFQAETLRTLSPPVGGSPGKAICLSVDVAPQFMNQG